MKRIEICGGIASGKTTLAGILEGEGFTGIYERFQDNPFLNDFYTKESCDNTFETEITFVLLHYNLIKSCSSDRDRVCDYSPLQDYCYGISNLELREREAFLNLYRYTEHNLNPPDLIIYLKCGVECLLERIRQRGRRMEQTITKEYLKSTVASIEKVIKDRKDVLVIESDKFNFIDRDRQYVIRLINDSLKNSE